MQSKAQEADKLTAVLRLQSELEAAREQAAQREEELRGEVQQVRRDKKEVEAKLGGLDLNQMEVRPFIITHHVHSSSLIMCTHHRASCASLWLQTSLASSGSSLWPAQ